MISQDLVKITLRAETEDISVQHAAKDCAPGFIEAVRAMQKKSRRWGWCTAVVTAKLKNGPDVEGNSYLGCCSYASREDFMQEGGYYQDMVKDAIRDLEQSLRHHYESVASDLESLADGEDDDLGELLTKAADGLRLKYAVPA